ncbi:MAG: hypothetical protein MUF42_12155 [Cytophagaceae bacterium]|nr:hypothetical protein [Cytophagaceae bacterium]
MERKYTYKPLVVEVTTPDQAYTKQIILDKNIASVIGIVMICSHPQLLFYRGSQKIDINGNEIIPEDFDSMLLMSGGIGVSPNDKFKELEHPVPAGNGEVKLIYKDSANALVAFAPYKVRLMLKCLLR